MKILKGIPGVSIYLDDVVISGYDREEHDKRLATVLEKIKDAGLTLNNKCVIAAESIEFVGLQIDADGSRPCANNPRAILEFKEPTNQPTQIKSNRF